MRKSSSSRNHGWARKKDYEVAEILVDLRHLFYKPSPGIAALLSSSSWGCKKSRSAIADDEKDDVVVVNDKSPTTAPLSHSITPSQSHHHNSPKPRRKSASKKETREDLLKKLDELTQCKDQLTKEVGVVREYHNKILTQNSLLKDMRQRQLQKRYVEEGDFNMVTKRMRTGETDFPCQQHMSFMYQTHQSCQVLSPEARYSGYGGGLNISSNGIPVGCRAIEPSSI